VKRHEQDGQTLVILLWAVSVTLMSGSQVHNNCVVDPQHQQQQASCLLRCCLVPVYSKPFAVLQLHIS
jgi:hypothetical protein